MNPKNDPNWFGELLAVIDEEELIRLRRRLQNAVGATLPAMTKRDLIERLAAYPDDTVLLVFNGDDGKVLPVIGLLYTPPYAPLDEQHQRKAYWPATLEFCTEEP